MTKELKQQLKRAQISAAQFAELELLASRSKGPLMEKQVVKFATNPKRALHRKFDWDNSIAGPKWRLHQAQMLLTNWKILLEGPAGPIEVRAFLHLPSEDGFRLTTEVLRSQDMVAEIAAHYRQRLIALQRDAKNIALLAKDPLYQKVQALLETEPVPV